MPSSFRTDFGLHWAVTIPVIWKLGLERWGANERHCLPCNASFSSPDLMQGPAAMKGRKPPLCAYSDLESLHGGLRGKPSFKPLGKWKEAASRGARPGAAKGESRSWLRDRSEQILLGHFS